jgi:hypothetical protein
MSKAKIEIVAKPIRGFEKAKEFAPHHLYVLITMSNGEQTAIRGGPAGGDDIKNWLFDDLKVIKLEYNDKHPDWDLKGIHSKHLLAQGDDAYISSLINSANFKQTFEWINNGKLDYKVAIPGVSWGSWQNSNTLARVMVEPTFRASDHRKLLFPEN